MKSSDGVNWHQVNNNLDQMPRRTGHSMLEFNEHLYIIAGHCYNPFCQLNDINVDTWPNAIQDKSRTTYYASDVWKSKDATTWELVTINKFLELSDQSAVVQNNEIWVLGGFNWRKGRLNQVISSKDGKNWTKRDNLPFPVQAHSCVIFQNKLFLLGGYRNNSYNNEVWQMTMHGPINPATHWTQAGTPNPFPPRAQHTSTVAFDKIYVVGGRTESKVYSDVWQSVNGQEWFLQSINQVPQRQSTGLVEIQHKLFLVAGLDVNSQDRSESIQVELGKRPETGRKQFASDDLQNKHVKVELNGNWQVSGEAGLGFDFQNITIPSSVHSVLMTNNVIEEPYKGMNEVKTSWVGQKDWVFSREMQVHEPGLKYFLNLENVDVFGQIQVNDVLVATTDNQFIKYTLNVTDQVVEGSNQLKVLLKSPYRQLKKLQTDNKFDHFWSEDISWDGPSARVYVRKPQIDFSWNWSPAIQPSGLMGSVSLVGIGSPQTDNSQAQFNDWTLNQVLSDDLQSAMCTVKIDVTQSSNHFYSDLVIKVQRHSTTIEMVKEVKHVHLAFYEGLKDYVTFTVDNIDLWWPHQMGEQNLYSIEVEVGDNQYFSSKTVGFRKFETINENKECLSGMYFDRSNIHSSKCASFEFKINNVSFQSKGINLVPMDALRDRITLQNFKWMIDLAIAANANFAILFGGGYYLPSSQLDQLDSKGLMFWNVFMFACGNYPVQDEFLENVKTEVKQQTLSNNHHPSIVVWTSNSENLAGILGTWFATEQEVLNAQQAKLFNLVGFTFKQISNNYIQFKDTVPGNNFTNDRSTSDQKFLENPNHIDSGDVHWQPYQGDPLSDDQHSVSPFVSETGWVTYPSQIELKNQIELKEFNHTSPVSMFRMREINGFIKPAKFIDDVLDSDAIKQAFESEQAYEAVRDKCQLQVTAEISQQRPVEDSDGDTCLLFVRRQLYLAQMSQGIIIKFAFKFQRYLQFTGRKNMGAFQWQFNDIWPGASCSILEQSLRPRIGQQQLKQVFKPVLIRLGNSDPFQDFQGNSYTVIFDSEELILKNLLEAGDSLTALFQFYVFDEDMDLKYLASVSKQFSHQDNYKEILKESELNTILPVIAKTFKKKSTNLQDQAIITITDKEGKTLQSDTNLFNRPKSHPLKGSKLQIVNVTAETVNKLKVSITSQSFSNNVYIETERVGVFDVMQFSMLKADTKDLQFDLRDPLEIGDQITFESSCQNCPYFEQTYEHQ